VRCEVQLTFGKQMQRNFVVYLRGIFAPGVTVGVYEAELFIVADCVVVSRISNSVWEYIDIVRLPNVRQLPLLVMRSGING